MKFEILPISELQFDKTNPRIARYVEMYGENPTATQISLALHVGEPRSVGKVTFHSLRESIRTHKGLIHPILVNRNSDGSYRVIEGNTRLAIYKEFHNNNVEGKWKVIPCMVYDEISTAEIDAVRLQAHLVGPREWDPYSKAKYLSHLRNVKYLTWSQVVDYCGGKAKEAEQYVNAYADMEEYYRKILEDESAFDVTRFSGFLELQKSRIKESILNAGFSLYDFAKWIDKRTISRLENVRSLPAILADRKIRDIFLQKGDKEALRLLDAIPADINLSNITLVQLARLLTERIRKISYEEVKKYKSDPTLQEPVALLDAKDELVTFLELITPSQE